MIVWIVLDRDGRFVSVHPTEQGARNARMHLAFGRVERHQV